MVLCDLPYGITEYPWDNIIPMKPLWDEYPRVTKPNAAIVLFAKQPFTTDLINAPRDLHRYTLYWEKAQGANFQSVKWQPFATIEEVLVFYRKRPTYNAQMRKGATYRNHRRKENGKMVGHNGGKRKVTFTENEGVRHPGSLIPIPRGKRERKFHQTQKPYALVEWLLKTYSNEGDLVLDNTAGSGTTGVVCRDLNREFILMEKDPEIFKVMEHRLFGREAA